MPAPESNPLAVDDDDDDDDEDDDGLRVWETLIERLDYHQYTGFRRFQVRRWGSVEPGICVDPSASPRRIPRIVPWPLQLTPGCDGPPRRQVHMWLLFEDESSSRAAKAVQATLMLLIVVSTGAE